MQMNEIIELARLHAVRVKSDVNLAATRIEHVRVTARANEAQNLYEALLELTGETDEVQTGTADGTLP
jgi:rRNA-processing protein FCF1